MSTPAFTDRRMSISTRTRQRLLWLSGRARGRGLHRWVESMTLDQLEDSRRPLLFSLLPRMLRRDGSTPEFLQRAFGYIDQGGDRAPAIMISSRRWRRALATSRKLASRRARVRKP
jgi:hypothetical protein